MDRPEWLPDVRPGDWIAEHLCPLGLAGTVGSTVPAVFDAYARVLHPATSVSGEPVTWARVCAQLGTTAHALMQWRSLSRTGTVPVPGGAVTERSAWDGDPPQVGSLPEAALQALVDVLARHTRERRCVYALWEGYGWVDTRGTRYSRTDADGVRTALEPPPSAFPPEVLDGPRLRLPGRDHLLFTGDLDGAHGLGDLRGTWVQSPTLFWPVDRSWCVATEVDFDSTVVGGSGALVAEILRCDGLEAWPVGPADSLRFDADHANTSPDSGS